MLLARTVARSSSLLIALALAGCNDQPADGSPPKESPQSAAPAGLPDRDPPLAHRLVEQEGALLLDVRTPEEYEAGHVDGARNIPHDQVSARIDELRSWTDGKGDAPIVVYCRSGRRSGMAKEALLEAGFSKVTNLGGMGNW